MSQEDAIIRHFKCGKTLTALEALDLGLGMRLASRISNLKELGFDIRDQWVNHNGKRFKRYWLAVKTPPADMFLSSDAQKQHEMAKA